MAGRFFTFLKQWWRVLIVLLVPLLLLPLPVVISSPQGRCGYIVLILTIYWVFEAIPIPVTSLLPLILFPMAGVIKADAVSPLYFQNIIALFFGSLSLAYAVESVNLHRRIALFVLGLVGTSTKWAISGLMVVTAFLSMWINNSSATSIMLPVALAISDELERHGRNHYDRKRAAQEATAAVNEVIESDNVTVPNGGQTGKALRDTFQIEEATTDVEVASKQRFCCPRRKRAQIQADQLHEQKYLDLKKAFLLATAYSATIGGLASLVGTAPNVFVKGFAEEQYKDTRFRINFLNFLLYALPVAVIMLILCWIWLQIFYNREEFFRCRVDPEARELQSSLKLLLVKQYKELGKPNWCEYNVAIVFIITIVLWLTKEFNETRGWDILFQKKYISDATVAVFGGILPLILPNSNPFKKDWKYQPIVQWNDLVKHIAWGAIFLLGAGLSVAEAFKVSGLSNTIADALVFLNGIPRAAMILLVIVISGFFTEVTSNLSTASIFFPVLDSIARSSQTHPAFLILPCTLAVSLAFMLPIATPPNAIVFSSGHIRVIDMVKTGIVMNLIGFLVIFLAALTWMPKIYNLDGQGTNLFYNNTMTTLIPTNLTMTI